MIAVHPGMNVALHRYGNFFLGELNVEGRRSRRLRACSTAGFSRAWDGCCGRLVAVNDLHVLVDIHSHHVRDVHATFLIESAQVSKQSGWLERVAARQRCTGQHSARPPLLSYHNVFRGYRVSSMQRSAIRLLRHIDRSLWWGGVPSNFMVPVILLVPAAFTFGPCVRTAVAIKTRRRSFPQLSTELSSSDLLIKT